MITLNKLHKKCEECKYKNSCTNKKMVSCELAKISQVDMNKNMSTGKNLPQLAARKHTPITIKMGEYGDVNTSMEQIA